MVYELQVTNCQLQMFKRGSEMTTKTAKSVASGKIQLKWVRSMICTPVKHKKVVKGWVHPAEPGDCAAGHGCDSRHGEEDPASGGDREVARFQSFKVATFQSRTPLLEFDLKP